MDVNFIINELGGTGKLAALCEVSSQAVSQWKKNGIPKAQRKYLQSIRPELFYRADQDTIKSGGRRKQDVA